MSTLIVEERLARIEALMLAMRCTAASAAEIPEAADACAWLQVIAKNDLAKIKASFGPDEMNRDTA